MYPSDDPDPAADHASSADRPDGDATRRSGALATDGGELPGEPEVDPAEPPDPAPDDADGEGSGATADEDPAGPEGEDAEAVTVEEGPGGREVVVPMALYKRVTVVSTLAAMVSIVAGFGLLDRATDRASVPLSQVDPLLAILGLGLIAAGGAIYAFSTRFRAAGMGSPKSDEGGSGDNG